MSAILLLVVGLACMAAGYFVYSRFIAQKILKLDPHFQTPAHEINDGVDYVPTNKYVLWGHHYFGGRCGTDCGAGDCGDLGLGAGVFVGGVGHDFYCRCA